MQKKRRQARLKLVTAKGTLVDVLLTRRRTIGRGSATGGVHSQKIVGGKLLAFKARRADNGIPRGLRDTFPLLPFLDSPLMLTDTLGHLLDRVPNLEDVGKGFHVPLIARDELSRQASTIVPVTGQPHAGTMCPMGRNKTPARMKSELAKNLKAARIAAGYKTQKDFADALGIEVERYKKWESGRTPIQHQYIPRACDLLNTDPNYLYYGIKEARKTA